MQLEEGGAGRRGGVERGGRGGGVAYVEKDSVCLW